MHYTELQQKTKTYSQVNTQPLAEEEFHLELATMNSTPLPPLSLSV